MTEKQAREQNYEKLTTVYLPSELWMLDRVKDDLARDRIEFIVVPESRGVRLWRKVPKRKP